jgi:hypothetical protein
MDLIIVIKSMRARGIPRMFADRRQAWQWRTGVRNGTDNQWTREARACAAVATHFASFGVPVLMLREMAVLHFMITVVRGVTLAVKKR